jgi:hypothetical protein
MSDEKEQNQVPDMSSEAIDRRLREVSALYRLGLSLMSARRVPASLAPPERRPPD